MLDRRYIEAFILFIAAIVAVTVGANVVALNPVVLSILCAVILIGLWTFTAGPYWWTPILTGAGVGGVFRVGFKIYPLEVCLGLCLLALIPLFLIKQNELLQHNRRKLPLLFHLAAIYITARFMLDIVPAHGARGNLGRVYLSAIWPFIFGWLFYRYGKLSVAPAAVGALFVATFLRSILGLVGYFSGVPLYIPGINYVLSFSDEDSLIYLRMISFILLIVLLILYNSTRSLVYRLLIFPLFGMSIVLVVMAASRFSTVMLVFLVLSFLVWSRRWFSLITIGFLSVACLIFINAVPSSIESLPEGAQRSLGYLVLKQNVLWAQEITGSSDQWHNDTRTEAIKRWTGSIPTFFFGYGVRPTPEMYETNAFRYDYQDTVEAAANTASYEAGLWSVVATLGVVGFLLYLFIFIHFWRQIIPRLLRRPTGNLNEGLIFWAGYTSIIWFLTSNFAGSFPSLELLMVIIASALVQEEEPVRAELQTS